MTILFALGLFLSGLCGITLGGAIARVLIQALPHSTCAARRRLDVALRVFGFLWCPALAAAFSNSYLSAGIVMNSLGTHFIWACVAAGVSFLLASPDNTP